jgi:hypothetical protein
MLGLGKRRGRMEPSEQGPKCSFCNRHQDELAELVAGPSVNICGECVRVCVDVLAEDARAKCAPVDVRSAPEAEAQAEARRANAEAARTATDSLALPAWHVRCELCRLIVATDDAVLVENRGAVCRPCVAAVVGAYEAEGRTPAGS